jgi:cobalt-zinc-cadmium efflux system outer membrane protein
MAYRQARMIILLSRFISTNCIAVSGACVQAQAPNSETLKVNIKQIEEQFLKNNLTLVAEKYNIDNAAAQIITAKLFANPDFNFQNGILNNTHDAYKNQSVGISQLFTTAGKRLRIRFNKLLSRYYGIQSSPDFQP